MMILQLFVASFVILALGQAVFGFHGDKFESKFWEFTSHSTSETARVKFTVALKLRNVGEMHNHFLKVSDPHSAYYGKYLSAREMDALYGPTPEGRRQVKAYFEAIPGSFVSIAEFGDLMHVEAPVKELEKHLNTELGYVKHVYDLIPSMSLRAKTDLHVPDEVSQHISFISLNQPVNLVKPRGVKAAERIAKREGRDRKAENSASITAGNEEAIVAFQAICGDGSTNTNNPPCSDKAAADVPLFQFDVYSYTNAPIDAAYTLTTDPYQFTLINSKVYCYNAQSFAACSGSASDATDGCTCVAKLSPLPKYTQLQVNVTATYPQSTTPTLITPQGVSTRFALTDVATPHLLSDLYSIPKGLQVNYGSNQSVAEWYHEYYSNTDLQQFMYLTGLPNATIPIENVYGDIPNDQSKPGGEAQLDVEYIMALAPNAETFFYSMNDTNPNDPPGTPLEDSNEGFLAYLELVDSQEYPPLVHSLSYGDIEATIFNASNNGSIEYGNRCNQEFMQMGLRGLTVLVSSGDDGIGSALHICDHAVPEWPASSPYITAIGATQLTDKYLPVCEQTYASSTLPASYQLDVECTGTAETVCSSTIGGVITSGGGFSDVTNRTYAASWQDSAVNYYLRQANAAAYPPDYYFNSYGRAYPDVATYGSNYFVYLGGKITRESGTSASAPVFAAMVTLWNDIRLQNNQAPMGFIAPFLYYVAEKNPEAFYDVTTGNNACGAGRSIDSVQCCEYSFGASAGWDAVTGLGSPNFEVIANLVINNQSAFPNLGAYPSGVSQQVYMDNGSDDDEVEVMSKAALGLGIGGVVFGLVSLSILIYFLVKGGKKDPLLNMV